MFFEQDYWIYFVLVPENIIVCAIGLKFIQHQMKLNNNIKYLNEMKEWMLSTKNLAKNTGLQLTLKINVPFSVPLRKLTNEILHSGETDWDEAIIEIWENKGNWNKIFQSNKYVEI